MTNYAFENHNLLLPVEMSFYWVLPEVPCTKAFLSSGTFRTFSQHSLIKVFTGKPITTILTMVSVTFSFYVSVHIPHSLSKGLCKKLKLMVEAMVQKTISLWGSILQI